MANTLLFSVSLVLPSGASLSSLQVPNTTTIAQLKLSIRKTLFQTSQSPALLRSSPRECLSVTKATVASYKIRLFAYCGEELRDTEAVTGVDMPICVLRPADIVTTSCNLSGNIHTSIFNSEEMTMWEESQQLSNSTGTVIELVVVSSAKAVFLCSAEAIETVNTLKKRVNYILGRDGIDINLWFRGSLLEDQSSLQACGVGNRSRLSVQFPGETLALAQDCKGNRAVFPISIGGKPDGMNRTIGLLEREWSMQGSWQEYSRINPFPQFSHFFLRSDRFSRLISLYFPNNKRESALIPSSCSIRQAKDCISAQHGLPAVLTSLSVIEELGWNKPFAHYGVKAEDSLVLIRKKMQSGPFFVKVRDSEGEICEIEMQTYDTVWQLKQRIRVQRHRHSLSVLKGLELLQEDSSTMAEIGLFDDVRLFCDTREAVQRHLQWVLQERMAPISMFSYAKSEDLEVCYIENALEESISHIAVRVITSKLVLFLRISSAFTVLDLKTALNIPPSYQFLYQSQPLSDQSTLTAQGIDSNSHLLLLSPSEIPITVQTASSHLFPLVISPQGSASDLARVLEQLTGLQASLHRLLYQKALREDEEMLPEAVNRLKVGSGRLWKTVFGTGFEVEEEAEADDLERMGAVEVSD